MFPPPSFVFGHRTSPPSTIAEGAADTRPIDETSAERPKSETPVPQEPHTGYIRSRRQPSLTRDERQPKDIRGSSKDVAQQRCLQRKASVNTQPKEMQVPWSLSLCSSATIQVVRNIGRTIQTVQSGEDANKKNRSTLNERQRTRVKQSITPPPARVQLSVAWGHSKNVEFPSSHPIDVYFSA